MVTKAALVLLLLSVALAQVYDDYTEGAGDYKEELMDVAFPQERFSEFITCLCMGLSSECTAHYSVSESTMTIEQIEKAGDVTTEGTHCKYYSCAHVADSQKITCAQIQQKSSACETGTIAQFFQHRDHKCCGLTCVGLFWANIGESLNLKQNVSDIVPCESSCLCPTVSPGGYTMTKLSPTSSSDSTEIGIYLINKTSSVSSPNGSSPTKFIPESIPTETVDEDIFEPIYYDDRTTLRTLDITLVNGKTTKSWRSPSSGKENDERDKIITIAVVVVVVVLITVCVIIGLIFIRRRQRRSRRLTLNAPLQGARGPNFSSDPELLHTIHRSEPETAPKLKPIHKPEVESAPKFYTKLKHENSFTIGKNGYRNSHNLSNSGGRSDRNSHARESVGDRNSHARESVGDRNSHAHGSVSDRNSHARGSVSPVTGEPDGKITIVDSSRINGGDAEESSQPLLTFPSSKESEV